MKTKQLGFYSHHFHNLDHRNDYIKWSSTYSLGIKLIDDQHMEILDFVNELLNNPGESNIEEHIYFKKAIEKAVKYIKDHFTTEERVMLALNYPGYHEHKRDHNNFILNVIKSAKDFEAGKRLVLTNFTHYLRNWVFTHIAVMDVQYMEYFREISTCCKLFPDRENQRSVGMDFHSNYLLDCTNCSCLLCNNLY